MQKSITRRRDKQITVCSEAERGRRTACIGKSVFRQASSVHTHTGLRAQKYEHKIVCLSEEGIECKLGYE